jgi:hypothetical protein
MQGTNPQAKDNDVFTRTDAFVAQTYRDLFQREADTAGLAYWQNQLQAGAPRGGIIDAFYRAGEFQNGVQRIRAVRTRAGPRSETQAGRSGGLRWRTGPARQAVAARVSARGADDRGRVSLPREPICNFSLLSAVAFLTMA